MILGSFSPIKDEGMDTVYHKKRVHPNTVSQTHHLIMVISFANQNDLALKKDLRPLQIFFSAT